MEKLNPKVCVVTDSVACLPRELTDLYGIKVMPLSFYSGGRVFKDWVDITPGEAYELFQKDPESFKTSAVSPSDCLDAYYAACNGSRDVFCVTLSSRLSAVYGVAVNTRDQLKIERPHISIEVMDSATATAAEGFIALAAARSAAEGHDLKTVIQVARLVKTKVNLFAFLDTLRYVYRSGRIPEVASRIGSVLNIKPLFTFSSGRPRFMGAVRSRNMGIESIVARMHRKIGDGPIHAAVMHVYANDEAAMLKERVSRDFNCLELWVTEFSPVMGYATGTGTLGIAFYKE